MITIEVGWFPIFDTQFLRRIQVKISLTALQSQQKEESVMKNRRVLFSLVLAVTLLITLFALPAFALPTFAKLRAALKAVVAEENGGLGFNMWATTVDRDGVVQLVAFSGAARGDQWPGGRVISAQKANSANAFSLPSLALSTANLYSAVQPGGSLFGLQFSNPVDTAVAYTGSSKNYGSADDPMVGDKIGGVNVFGGGLPLYDKKGKLVGAIGVSGDSSCADHNIAWKVRHALRLDYISTGESPTKDDNIVYDIANGVSASGWGHSVCSAEATQIAEDLPTTHPISVKP
jgi:uncharacterized protein GlcG (DUF336 family)